MFCSFKADLTGPWIKSSASNIILYTRPEHYSKVNSPDSMVIRKILSEQNRVIDYVNDHLQTKFHSKVRIYMFNYDEAKVKIGTNGGGFCNPLKSRIYFTYFENPNKNYSTDSYIYVGIHEMVHIITYQEIGWPKSKLFGEGFANAIDGTYGRVPINDRMKEFVEKNNVIKPSDLLNKPDISERIFYPQSGFFINWLLANYGVERVKAMYKFRTYNFANEFKQITKEDFDFMTKKYLKFCKDLE